MLSSKTQLDTSFNCLANTYTHTQTQKIVIHAWVPMGEAREHAWFGLFDEAGMVTSLKGVSGLRRDTVFGDSQSRGSWHPI